MKITVDISKNDIKGIKAEIERLDKRKLKSSLRKIGKCWLEVLVYNSGGEIDDPEDFVDLR